VSSLLSRSALVYHWKRDLAKLMECSDRPLPRSGRRYQLLRPLLQSCLPQLHLSRHLALHNQQQQVLLSQLYHPRLPTQGSAAPPTTPKLALQGRLQGLRRQRRVAVQSLHSQLSRILHQFPHLSKERGGRRGEQIHLGLRLKSRD
jgi:hypothetical protein